MKKQKTKPAAGVQPKQKAKAKAKVSAADEKKAVALSVKAITATDPPHALSGKELDAIVAKVPSFHDRGPLRRLLRAKGLHPQQGKRRGKDTVVDAKAIQNAQK